MSAIVLSLAVAIALATLPVMFAARVVGAERTGFGSAFLSVVLQLVLSAILKVLMPNAAAVMVVGVFAGSAIYAYVLGTSILKGFMISVIALVIALVAILLLGGSFALLASAA